MKTAKSADSLDNTTQDTTHTSVQDADSGSKFNAAMQTACSALNALCCPHRSNPNPECEGECRFSYGPSMTTAMYYAPIFDKYGNNLNPDGNTTSGEVSCSTCNKKWTYTTRYGVTTYQEVTS